MTNTIESGIRTWLQFSCIKNYCTHCLSRHMEKCYVKCNTNTHTSTHFWSDDKIDIPHPCLQEHVRFCRMHTYVEYIHNYVHIEIQAKLLPKKSLLLKPVYWEKQGRKWDVSQWGSYWYRGIWSPFDISSGELSCMPYIDRRWAMVGGCPLYTPIECPAAPPSSHPHHLKHMKF
jgi:hypothetical protein